MATAHAIGSFPRSGHIPPQNVSVPGANEAWWQGQGKPDLTTVPRIIVERLRSVHLAQLDELTRLRIEVAKTRGGQNNIRRAEEELRAARSKSIGLQADAATAAKDVAQNIETIKVMRQNCVEFEAQLRDLRDRERTLEERFNARAAKAAETERSSVMHMELSIVGIDLNELRELEIVRLVTRPLREAASQCLGLSRSSTSACRTEQHGRIGLHLHLPKELRSQPERFREFKKHFVEAKRSGELRTRLEEGLVDLENEFGARVTVRSVSQPILLDGAFVVVPEGVGALGMVPEGHPPGLVTLWQVAPGSWAQKAGIRSGDTLAWLNKQPVTEIEVGLLAERIRSRRPLAMYVVRAPGPGVQRSREEAAAKRIQTSYRQKLARNRALDQKRQLRLVELHHAQGRQAAAGAEEKRRMKENAEMEKILNERAANKERMEGALAKEEEERNFHEQRLREKWDEEKLQQIKRDQERRAEQRRQERERVATQIQAGWRGSPARIDTESIRQGPAAETPKGVRDLSPGVVWRPGEEDVIIWDVETNDKKLGMKLRGEPPNDQVFISSVTPDSWADLQKLRVGDEILMVGGLPLDEMSSQSFYRALKLRPVRLTLSRSASVQALMPGGDDQLDAAAARIQAGWRGRQGRLKASDLRRDVAQGKSLAEQQIAAERVGGAPSGIAPHQWIKVIVEEGVRSIGWTPSGMAPNPMIVEDVVDGSWAQGKRLQVGDELKTVAGMDVGDLDERQVKTLMKQRPLALVFYRREGQEGDAKLVKVVAKEDVGKMGWLPDVTDPPRPVMVASVDPTSWAQREGLLVGDELVKIDGSVVSRMTQKELLRDLKRRPVELVFKRRPTLKKPKEVFEAPESNDYTVTAYENDKVLGFVPGGVPPYEVPVDYVDEGSWANEQGIQKDDLLISINGQSIDQFDEGTFLEAMRVRPLVLAFTPAKAASLSSSPTGVTGPTASGTQYEVVADIGEGQLGMAPSAMPPSRVYIHEVEDDKWASRSGVLPGDELLTVNGKSISQLNRSDFLKLMKERPARLVFMRGDGNVPADGGAGVGEDGGTILLNFDVEDSVSTLGFVLVDATPPEPLLVFEVGADGWAAEKGLLHGDELVKIDGRSVSQMSMERVMKALKYRPVRLTFKRYEGQPHEVEVFMTLEGLELAAIEEDDFLYEQFIASLSDTIAQEAGIHPEQLQLVLSEGSVRVHAKIILPITQANEVQTRLRNSQSFSTNVVDVVRNTPGIEVATRGRIAVRGLDVRDSELSSLDFTVPAGVDRLGFVPDGLPPNTVMVEEVAPGTWAEEVLLIAGRDELHAVDGRRVQTMTQKELFKAMKRRPVQLSFLRHAPFETDDRPKKEQKRPKKDGNSFTLTASEAVESLGFMPGSFPPDAVVVEEVTPGSWSAQNGLMKGADELTAVDGQKVSQMTKKELIKAMKKRPVKLTFERDSSRALKVTEEAEAEKDLSLLVDQKFHHAPVPEKEERSPRKDDTGEGKGANEYEQQEIYDLEVPEYVEALGFGPSDWPPAPVFVADIEPGSWADENGLCDGLDELVEIDGEPVAEMSKKELKNAMKRRPVQLSFIRAEEQPDDDIQNPPSSESKEKKAKKEKKEDVIEENPDLAFYGATDAEKGSLEDHEEDAIFFEEIQKDKKAKKDRAHKPTEIETDFDVSPRFDVKVEDDQLADGGDGKEFDVYADEDVGSLGFWPSGMEGPSDMPPEDMYIDAIEDGLWAQQQGLQVDDFLMMVNGEDVYSMDKKAVSKMMRKVRPLTLTFWRRHPGGINSSSSAFDGEAQDVEEKADDDNEWPAWPEQQDTFSSPSKTGKDEKKDKKKVKKEKRESESIFDGMFALAGLDEEDANPKDDVKRATQTAHTDDVDLGWTLKGKPPQPVVVDTIEAFGWADTKKFKVGDQLTVINGKQVSTLSDEEFEDLFQERPLKVTLERKRKEKKKKSHD